MKKATYIMVGPQNKFLHGWPNRKASSWWVLRIKVSSWWCRRENCHHGGFSQAKPDWALEYQCVTVFQGRVQIVSLQYGCVNFPNILKNFLFVLSSCNPKSMHLLCDHEETWKTSEAVSSFTSPTPPPCHLSLYPTTHVICLCVHR